MPDRFTEQEFLYEYELDFTRRIRPFLLTLGAARLSAGDNPVRVGTDPEFRHAWLLGWRGGKHYKDGRFRTWTYFAGADYVNGESEVGERAIYDMDEGRTWSRRVRAESKGFKITVRAKIEMEEVAPHTWG